MAEVSAATSVDLAPIRLVDPDGSPTAEDRYTRDLPPETLSWLYELMVVTRDIDGEFINLQRQGELALFASCRGQEAAQIGAAACLRKTDWLFPQYREIGAFLLRGITAESVSPSGAAPRSLFPSAPTDCTRSARRWAPSGWARIR
jgi:pyruvate dehydrogenase E1 component alpha subunit